MKPGPHSRITERQFSLAASRAYSISGIAKILKISRAWAYILAERFGYSLKTSFQKTPTKSTNID